MESSSTVDASPSFNTHSSNNLPDIADRVVQELRTDNGFGDDFDFGVDNDQADTGEIEGVMTNTLTGKLNENEEDAPNEDEIEEFEFPIVCRDSNLFPVSTDDVSTDNQVSPSYPLFDRSLLLDVDPNSSNAVDSSRTDPYKPSPAARHSLMMLFREDHSASSSSSEADDLDGITPGTYCVWKPKSESHGKHKKSNSISFDNNNNSKRWKVRDLLKRSYSDDNYSAGKEASVVLFTPPIATKQKINSEKVKKTEKTAKLASAVDGDGIYSKTESNIPVHRAKAGGNRLPPYLPYRPDQHGQYANFTGSSRNLYRY